MVESHRRQQSLATVAIAHPTGRNEILALNEQGCYIGTKQGKKQKHSWVNACSMVLEARAFDYLKGNQENHFALSLMDCLAAHEPVQTYRHEGFWSPVETIRDKTLMETYGHSIKHRGRCGKIRLHHGRWRQREPWRVNK